MQVHIWWKDTKGTSRPTPGSFRSYKTKTMGFYKVNIKIVKRYVIQTSIVHSLTASRPNHGKTDMPKLSNSSTPDSKPILELTTIPLFSTRAKKWTLKHNLELPCKWTISTTNSINTIRAPIISQAQMIKKMWCPILELPLLRYRQTKNNLNKKQW